jgi:uncharacterized membrane-anchored protein YitT (DUF2179 family)
MLSIINKYRIQLIIALVTICLAFLFPAFERQFLLISFVGYIILSACFSLVVSRFKFSNTYIYISHLIAFLIAYSFFIYVLYSFATISSFPMMG